MPVIAIKKDCPLYEFKDKKSAKLAIISAGDDVSNYEFKYVYNNMRKALAKSYQKRHNEAALRYYHKNKQLKGDKNDID